jgi:DNA-binding protein HU-beta
MGTFVVPQGSNTGKRVRRMDRSALVEAVTRKAAEGGDLSDAQVGRVIDAVFGTVEEAGAIAQALKEGQTVTLVGFGSFHHVDGEAGLRPGKALNEYVNDQVR